MKKNKNNKFKLQNKTYFNKIKIVNNKQLILVRAFKNLKNNMLQRF